MERSEKKKPNVYRGGYRDQKTKHMRRYLRLPIPYRRGGVSCSETPLQDLKEAPGKGRGYDVARIRKRSKLYGPHVKRRPGKEREIKLFFHIKTILQMGEENGEKKKAQRRDWKGRKKEDPGGGKRWIDYVARVRLAKMVSERREGGVIPFAGNGKQGPNCSQRMKRKMVCGLRSITGGIS